MNNRHNIQDELITLGSGLSADIQHGYTVPAGYFEHFADSVLSSIKKQEARDELVELSPLLAGISKKMPFSVPQGYFNESETIENINEEKLPAVFEFIGKDMPYSIPAGYFQDLPYELLNKVKPQAKVVSFNRRPAFTRMLVAAAITGIMAITGFFYFTNNGNGSQTISGWMAKKMKNVSDKDLEQFINNTDAMHSDVAQNANHTNEVRTMMADVSEKEIDAFLSEIPTDDEDLEFIN